MSLARGFVRRAIVARPSAFIRRGYADIAPDKLRLSLALPHEVNLPSTAGDIGILADHVPTIQQLRPGLVEVIESTGATKQFVISGGFATVGEGSTLSINAVEAYAPEDLSADAIKSLLAEAQKNSSSSDETEAAIAKIELEVLEAIQPFAK